MNSHSGFFLDSGDVEAVEKWNSIIGGVTTNQIILFSKDLVKDIPKRISEICRIVGKEKTVSIELPDSEWEFKKLIEIGQKFYAISPANVVIKVPIITTSNKGLLLIKHFTQIGIRTNATVGMNFGQLTMAAEAGRLNNPDSKPNFISLFWARTIESKHKYNESTSPEVLLKSVKKYLFEHNLSTKIIVGSIRNTTQVCDAFDAGADIVTIAPNLLLELLSNKRAKETIEEFDKAFRDVEISIKLV